MMTGIESSVGDKELPKCQCYISILWPSFVVAAVATVLFFSVFDPENIMLETWAPNMSRTAAYSIGFLLFWLLGAASSFLTCFFRKPQCDIRGRRST